MMLSCRDCDTMFKDNFTFYGRKYFFVRISTDMIDWLDISIVLYIRCNGPAEIVDTYVSFC